MARKAGGAWAGAAEAADAPGGDAVQDAAPEDGRRAGPPAIEVRDLTIRRGGRTVIDGASFAIPPGEFVGIVGPNGGGKTTLIQGLLGLLPIASGHVMIFGQMLRQFRDWDRVGYVSQSATAYDASFPLTVRELVGIGLVSRKTLGRPHRSSDWKRVVEELEFMGIAPLARRRIGELSGGEKQRVAVARALVRRPDLLVLDEPESGMDASALESFYGKLSQLQRERGTTILVVSHDLSTVFCRMSSVICVNRVVCSSPIMDGAADTELLKRVYGDHFTFVFHRHECRGRFS
ncbi:MAG: metal ABC transporter ATP-binding protein [Thermoplasmatota archaeon]